MRKKPSGVRELKATSTTGLVWPLHVRPTRRAIIFFYIQWKEEEKKRCKERRVFVCVCVCVCQCGEQEIAKDMERKREKEGRERKGGKGQQENAQRSQLWSLSRLAMR